MGKLKGVLPITGTFGNLSFVDTREGIVVKSKSSITKKRVLEGNEFERTRENNREFTAAAKGSKLLRHALKGGIFAGPDRGFMNRLNSRLLKIIRTDTNHARGERTIQGGDFSLLRQIECNIEHRLYDQFYADYSISADRTAGTVTASFNSFFADCMVDAPKTASHYRLVLIAALLDFENNTWEKDIAYSDHIRLQAQQTDGFSLVATLDAGSTLPIVVALAVEYYTFTGGLFYPVEMGAVNPMAIVKGLP